MFIIPLFIFAKSGQLATTETEVYLHSGIFGARQKWALEKSQRRTQVHITEKKLIHKCISYGPRWPSGKGILTIRPT